MYVRFFLSCNERVITLVLSLKKLLLLEDADGKRGRHVDVYEKKKTELGSDI